MVAEYTVVQGPNPRPLRRRSATPWPPLCPSPGYRLAGPSMTRTGDRPRARLDGAAGGVVIAGATGAPAGRPRLGNGRARTARLPGRAGLSACRPTCSRKGGEARRGVRRHRRGPQRHGPAGALAERWSRMIACPAPPAYGLLLRRRPAQPVPLADCCAGAVGVAAQPMIGAAPARGEHQDSPRASQYPARRSSASPKARNSKAGISTGLRNCPGRPALRQNPRKAARPPAATGRHLATPPPRTAPAKPTSAGMLVAG